MFNVSKKEVMERWDNLPQTLRDALWSEYNFDVLEDVCKREHLSDDKISTVATLVGDVIMGFILPDDLSKEIAENVEINREIADNTAREIEKKILRPVMSEIKEIYAPPTEKAEVSPGKKEGVIQLERLGEEKPAVRVGVEKEEQPFDITQGKPLIIHKEEGQEPVTEEKKFKGFEFPFGIFEKEGGRAATSEPVKVRVESPGVEAKKKPEKRIVHYSEYRTPLTPFGRPEEEIIDLPTLTKREPPPKTLPKTEATKPPEQKIPEPKPPKGPSIEGNTIDLKNL